MSLLRKAALVNGAEFITLSVSVLQTAVLARILGPAGIGQYALILSTLMLAPSLCCLGVPFSFLYHSKHYPQNTKEYLINALWIVLFLTIPGGLILCSLVFSLPNYFGYVTWFALIGIGLYVPIHSIITVARNVLLTQIEALKLGLLRFLPVFSSLSLILLVYTAWTLQVPQALLCLVLGALIAAVVGWIWVSHYLDLSIKPSWKTSRQLILMGVRLNWVELMVLANSQINIFIVKYLLDDFEYVGYFSRAMRIAMLTVISGQAVLPLLFSRWASFPEERISGHVEKVMRFASTVSIIMTVCVLLFGKWLILVLYGRDFLLSKALFLLLGSRGVPELSALSLFIGVIVNIAFSFLLIPKMGITGAAWAATIGNAVLLLTLTVIVKRKYHIGIIQCICLRREDCKNILYQILKKTKK